MTSRTRTCLASLVVALLALPVRAHASWTRDADGPQAAGPLEPRRLTPVAASPGDREVAVRTTRTGDELPASLDFPACLRSEIRGLWQASATFRRQCTRLAQSSLEIRVLVVGRVPVAGLPRAATTLRIEGSRVRGATVWLDGSSLLRSGDALAELLGHEFEHVIEVLDGADYAVEAATARRRAPRGIIETERARRAGAAGALEARAARP